MLRDMLDRQIGVTQLQCCKKARFLFWINVCRVGFWSGWWTESKFVDTGYYSPNKGTSSQRIAHSMFGESAIRAIRTPDSLIRVLGGGKKQICSMNTWQEIRLQQSPRAFVCEFCKSETTACCSRLHRFLPRSQASNLIICLVPVLLQWT